MTAFDSAMHLENNETSLYRAYNAKGVLLYVGITANLGRRLRDHAKTSGWWGDMARIETSTYRTRSAALDAEAQAIKWEKPLWNHGSEGHYRATRGLVRATFDGIPFVADREEWRYVFLVRPNYRRLDTDEVARRLQVTPFVIRVWQRHPTDPFPAPYRVSGSGWYHIRHCIFEVASWVLHFTADAKAGAAA